MLDFISLRHMLIIVASHMDVAHDDINYYASQVTGMSDSVATLKMCTRCTDDLFRISRAAMRMLGLLFQQPVKINWFDKAEIGTPLLSSEAKEEGKAILIKWAQREEQMRSELSWNQFSSYSRWNEKLPSGSTFSYVPRLPRMWEIGFERSQITELLVGHGIIPRPVLRSSKTDATKRKHAFRGPLTEVLEEAIKKADDSGDAESIWQELVKMASSTPPIIPLIGYCSKRGILFTKDSNVGGALQDEQGSMSRSAFSKKIRARLKSA